MFRDTHIRKKKTHQGMMLTSLCFQQGPQYQPQLQMIQMVGPNDNDYIYINFKHLQYDSKWEFPRENLELGMHDNGHEK